MHESFRPLSFLSIFALFSGGAAQAASWDDVAPIFQDRCVLCHEGEFAPLGLSLVGYDTVMKGSENGPVVIAGDPDASPIIHRLTGQAEPQMPMDGPPFLDEAQIALIRDWIAAGAEGPVGDAVQEAPVTQDPYADGKITYGEVEGIFKQRCVKCHSDNSVLAAAPEGLHLSSLAEVLAGGERLAVVPGNPLASELMRRIEGRASPRMPMDGPPWLEDDQIALIRDWISGGAMDDDFTVAPMPVGREVRYRAIMTGPTEIDGIGFTITGNTRVKDRPAVGQMGELRATIGPDGAIIATRLRDR